MKPFLLDVNVLVALFDPAHVNHEAARRWFKARGSKAWATCPITENGFVRVVSHPGYPSVELRTAEAIRHLKDFAGPHPAHRFWNDSISITDSGVFDSSIIVRSNQVTDVYLLGLAAKNAGRLATFDRAISTEAIKNCPKDLVEQISASP